MKAEAKLVRKGRDVSLARLLDQARFHHRLQEEHAERLRKAGWTERHARALLERIAKVEAAVQEAIAARLESKTNLARERAAQAQVRRFKRRFVEALDDLRADRRIDVPTYKAMKESGPLFRSTPRMLEYLTAIAGMVERHDPLLAPYFAGENASAELRAVLQELETAQARQETGRSALPQKTKEVYLAKARLLMSLEQLYRIAQIAYAEEPAVLRSFRLRRLAPRRRRSSGATKVAEETVD